MLTALDGVDDRVRGLEVGADDYLTKPFAFRELVARLKALARRRPALSPSRHRIADLEVDLGTRQVQRRGRPITLSAKEFALLELFVLHRGRVLDRSTITAHVWDDNHDPFANLLEVLVGRLRRKIDDGFEPKLITTLRGPATGSVPEAALMQSLAGLRLRLTAWYAGSSCRSSRCWRRAVLRDRAPHVPAARRVVTHGRGGADAGGPDP